MNQRTLAFETTLSFEAAGGRVGTAVLTAHPSGWRITAALDEDGQALTVPAPVAETLRRRAAAGEDETGV